MSTWFKDPGRRPTLALGAWSSVRADLAKSVSQAGAPRSACDRINRALPVYMLAGANELRGRRELAHEWFARLAARHKELITYADAGHAVAFEQVDAFRQLMVEQIVPATYDPSSRGEPAFIRDAVRADPIEQGPDQFGGLRSNLEAE